MSRKPASKPASRPVLATALATSLLSMMQLSAATAITIPPALQTPATQTMVLEAQATGVQFYTCTAATTQGGNATWVFNAPEATLYAADGTRLGTHYAGPTWESVDGSKVVGKMQASATPSSDAIPWLLLSVKTTQGNGVFGRITAVQRLATEGGIAPADGCKETAIGTQARVPYKAVYRFYATK